VLTKQVGCFPWSRQQPELRQLPATTALESTGVIVAIGNARALFAFESFDVDDLFG
jgi:hypothetical protein